MTEQTPDQGTYPYPADSKPTFTPSRTAVARLEPSEIEQLLAPVTVDMRTWLTGLLSDEDFPEADPEQQTLGILASILTAETSEKALAALNLSRAKELCGGEPGGRSPVLEITGARPLKSDYAEGAACYVIVEAVILDGGENIRFTTGARAVQTMIWKHIYEGWMPFKGCLEIRRERTKNGYHPLNLVAGI